MDSNIVAALISGISSIVSALGALYLKEYLDSRKASATKPLQKATPVTKDSAPAEEPSIKAPIPSVRFAVSIRRPIIIVVGSFLFGVITRTLRSHFTGNIQYESLIAFVVLIGLAVAFAVFHRRKGFQSAFQLENFALWTGFASGWSLVHGGVWGDLLAPWWLGCSVVGGLVVRFRRTSDAQQHAAADG
jgi:hypothetical protein